MKILITGAAGFIGAALIKRMLEVYEDDSLNIIGIDNLNDYYDPALKIARLSELGVNIELASNDCNDVAWDTPFISHSDSRFRFVRLNLQDSSGIETLFDSMKFDYVVNLAAQAGVRYSLINPKAYVESNIAGFLNILEGCRKTGVRHLVYASSSSVYGMNSKIPFSEADPVDCPVSLYAATKKANELMAHTYSHLYNLPTTGLRFFTVYGPWGRPDMSPFLFIDKIMNGKEIEVYNQGDMYRDFTYIDDIVEGIIRIMKVIPGQNQWNHESVSCGNLNPSVPYSIYNIGHSTPVKLTDYIETIEKVTGKKAIKKLLPMQPGDVYRTYADISSLQKKTGFHPTTTLEEGLRKTVDWYKKFYG